MVRVKGLEPPRDCSHTDLNRTRLPIPPHPQSAPLIEKRRLSYPSIFRRARDNFANFKNTELEIRSEYSSKYGPLDSLTHARSKADAALAGRRFRAPTRRLSGCRLLGRLRLPACVTAAGGWIDRTGSGWISHTGVAGNARLRGLGGCGGLCGNTLSANGGKVFLCAELGLNLPSCKIGRFLGTRPRLRLLPHWNLRVRPGGARLLLGRR